MLTGRTNFTTTIRPEVRTSASTWRCSLITRRAYSPGLVSVAAPLTAWARAGDARAHANMAKPKTARQGLARARANAHARTRALDQTSQEPPRVMLDVSATATSVTPSLVPPTLESRA